MTAKSYEAPRIYPALRYHDATAAIDFLTRAFGFTLHARYMQGDEVAHAQMCFGSSMIMLGSDGNANHAIFGKAGAPGSRSIYIAVEDPDATFARAEAAGARIVERPSDRDYGSREFICADPEGNIWSFGTYWPKADDTFAAEGRS